MTQRTTPLLVLLVLIGLTSAYCVSVVSGNRAPVEDNGWIRLLGSGFHDFGRIWHGERPTHSFRIRNVAGQPIDVSALKIDCSCAHPKLTIETKDGERVDRKIFQLPVLQDNGSKRLTWIEPGEQLVVTMQVNTDERLPISRTILGKALLLFAATQSNAVPEPAAAPEGKAAEPGHVMLGFEAHVEPRLRIAPSPRLEITDIARGQVARSLVKFYALPERPFSITRIEPGAADTRVEKIDTSGDELRYMISVGPIAKPGLFERTITFHTDMDNGYSFPIEVAGLAADSIGISDYGRLNFGRFDFSKPNKVTIEATYNVPDGKLEWKVASLRVQDAGAADATHLFQAEVTEREDRTYDITVHYKGGLESPEFSGSLVLSTSDPDHKRIELEITGFAIE